VMGTVSQNLGTAARPQQGASACLRRRARERASRKPSPPGHSLLRLRSPGSDGSRSRSRREPLDRLGQQSFLALQLVVFHLLAVFQAFKPVAVDAAEVNEDVLAFGVEDEP